MYGGMKMTWIYLTLFVFATFRLTRLIVFDKITTFIRKPFHKIVEDQDEEGNRITYLEIKGKGLRRWIGESPQLLLVHGHMVCGRDLF